MKSLQNYLREHPKVATAVRWGVPITVGLGVYGVTLYLINSIDVKTQEPELDKCAKEAAASSSNLMNNCTNFVWNYACNVAVGAGKNISKHTGIVTEICGETIPQSSMYSFPYNCSLKDSTNILLRCISVEGFKESKLMQFFTLENFGSFGLGGLCAVGEFFVQKKVLEPSSGISSPRYSKLAQNELE